MRHLLFGLVLIAVFAVGMGPIPGLFPTGGLHSTDVDPTSLAGVFDTMWHLFLPVLTLALAYLADYSLIMRGSLIALSRMNSGVFVRATHPVSPSSMLQPRVPTRCE